MPTFSKKSTARLATCKPKIQKLFNEVIKHYDCSVLCGYRDENNQRLAVTQGFSFVSFPNSRHNSYPSDAVDIVPYPIDWNDKARFYEFAGFVKGVASQLGIIIQWGGNFKNFFDAPHFQLEG